MSSSGSTETFTLPSGLRLSNVHPKEACEGRLCVVHNPTTGYTKDWPLTWREDRGIFERHCKHGVGHPAVEQLTYWNSIGESWQSVHGCCGECNCFERGVDDE